MAEDELLKLRQALRERQKASMVQKNHKQIYFSIFIIKEMQIVQLSFISFQEKPKVFLTLEELAKENTPNFGTDLKDEDIPPLFVSDVQSLILFAVQGSACKIKPRYNCLLLFLERGFTLN